ncbi:MAG: hypothetical protein H5T90_01950 [Acetomicrobium sp.]|uniref:Uncharacterized protein n=1 Tax=Acetomicrobium thermoterrenum DSM 13490 TaxID=1120987 RepID=A0A1H3G9N2_9BACT|nr:hypothetical protein [Acetomicrobium thermoterrenum]MBC7321868.1 hypothetical protein [Acetomicrobium sp.]SDX99986.1 hypothetical protein SAMN03080603_01419 [Acetomicrobium thermoterrenum DSM 13490]
MENQRGRFSALNAAATWLCSSKARRCAKQQAAVEATAAAAHYAVFKFVEDCQALFSVKIGLGDVVEGGQEGA